MQDRVRRLLGALALTVCALGLYASRSEAGTLTVNFNAYADAAPGCGIWTLTDAYGPLSSWIPAAPCGGPNMGISNAGGSIAGPATAGQRVSIQTTAPAGVTITGASVNGAWIANINNGQGWGGGSFYAGGAGLWHNGNTVETDSGIWSPYWGFAMICGWSQCTNVGAIYPTSVTLTAVENQGPSVLALGPMNLWDEGGRYVWNPPGDPWSIALVAWDPSGVCSVGALVDSFPLNGPAAVPNTSVWQQCPDQFWDPAHGASVDTRSYVPTAGPLSLELDATNAAAVQAAPSETLQVDNLPVGVSLTDPNDPNPANWVNHAVTVDAQATTGPSGIGGIACSVDSAKSTPYTASGIVVDGDGAHTVACNAWNNAIDPQGAPQYGSASQTIHIDETPPTVAFEARNPSNPDQLVVDTGDSESGVATGTIYMAPAGTGSWTALPTSFDGSHLIANVNDTGLSGNYVFRAVSCDNVNNCAATQQTLALPLRVGAHSYVGFQKIIAPAKVVRKRVLVGFRYRRLRRHHRLERQRVGGHYITVQLVIRRNATCATRRVRTGRRRWEELTACRVIKIATKPSERVGYGRPVVLDGLLLSTEGVPIAGAPVDIQTAPDNGVGQFSTVATITTGANGGWSATLPAGPSRLVRAVYLGSPTVLPASGQATVNVPARIDVAVNPRVVPWSGTVTLRGHLAGGYIPRDGVALRLLIRLPGRRQPYEPIPFRTDASGNFSVQWTWGTGSGVVTYPFAIATTATESDYPFAAAQSRWTPVTFGLPTPASQRPAHRRNRHHPRRTRH